MPTKIGIIEIAEQIKDDEARNILENIDIFPEDWVENAKRRLEISTNR